MTFPSLHEPSGRSVYRRSHRRFPLHVELEYKLLEGSRFVSTGTGRTLNLSSHGVLFECEEILPIGTRIRLVLTWPARLDGTVGLALCVNGLTVRSDGTCTAVEIVTHEFRTRPLQVRVLSSQPVKTVADMRLAARDLRTMSA